MLEGQCHAAYYLFRFEIKMVVSEKILLSIFLSNYNMSIC